MMSSSDEDDIYEVEKVVGKRITKKGRVQYRVHWKGYSSRNDSWEPLSNLGGCQTEIRKFNLELQKKQVNLDDTSSKQFYKNKMQVFHSTRPSPNPKLTNSLSGAVIKRPNNQHELAVSASTSLVASRLLGSVTEQTRTSKMNQSLSPQTKPSSKVVSPPSLCLLNSAPSVAKISPSKRATSKDESDQPQRTFRVGTSQSIAVKWLEAKNAEIPNFIPDHDYLATSPPPRPQLNLKSLSPFYIPQRTGARKSLRVGRTLQARMVFTQWKENYVEIIFVNTERKNSLTPRFMEELCQALDATAASRCAVVVLSTVGDYFCSGLDTKYMIEVLSESRNLSDTARKLANKLRTFVEKLIEFQKILIAVVQGPAIGLGCAMLGLFDTVYCSDKGLFWTPYSQLGQTPEACSSMLFPEIMGWPAANDMLINGSCITANQAKERGLVTEVFPHDTMKGHALAHIQRIASRSSEAMMCTKHLMRRMKIKTLKHVNCVECNQLEERWSSQDSISNFKKFYNSTL